MPRKKKKHHSDHMDESWLIPYADLLTLLLALFIVLFASSSIDADKYQRIVQAFDSAFNGSTGILDEQAPAQLDNENDGSVPLALDEEKENEITDEELAEKQAEREMEALMALQKKMDKYIGRNNLEVNFKTELSDEGLLITIQDVALFDSGSAAVKPEAQQLASDMSHLLVTNPPRNIVISGHTDNVPIHNARFESNWHLSVMRAVNFMKILLENDQLDPQKFSAKGFGEHKPVSGNDNAEGRQNNRRVEVLILPNLLTENAGS
ncbi:flagellar motor protein MotB [Bacillus marinisedimentorum]|uniref:flagellar motor protein MotB n=1 Tax=Bacillus marinisedimentorum TaxID=1821260 RepID=UPI0007E17FF7|nr:flagellar motor protein MotB [Bacillus marinisedimentorum]